MLCAALETNARAASDVLEIYAAVYGGQYCILPLTLLLARPHVGEYFIVNGLTFLIEPELSGHPWRHPQIMHSAPRQQQESPNST